MIILLIGACETMILNFNKQNNRKILQFSVLLILIAVSVNAKTLINFGKDDKFHKHFIISTDFNKPFGLPEFILLNIGLGDLMDINLFSKKHNFIGEVAFGVLVEPEFFYLRVTQGLAVIQETNRDLSGHIQFPTHISFGLQTEGIGVGIYYRHYSDGNLTKPNFGRDYVGFEIVLR